MDLRTTILPHRDRLFRLALGITCHRAEAEDIVQDTMLRAWEQRDEWSGIQNVGAWLTQICRNLALDHKKRAGLYHTVRPAQGTDPAAAIGLQAEGSTHASPDTVTEARETYHLLSQLMEELPPPQDEIVRLRDIEGFSYRDIAVQLQLSETQVRVYLHRARQRIKQEYLRIQNYHS